MLAKIEEILAWEQNTDQERGTRFVEPGRYLCEVRAGQYWRLDNLGSFDEFLEKRFLEEEVEAALGASRSQRVAERSGYRHGAKPRRLTLRTGLMALRVPRARLVSPDGAEREWQSGPVPRDRRLPPRRSFQSLRRGQVRLCKSPGVLTYDWTKNGGQVSGSLVRKWNLTKRTPASALN